MERLFSSSLVAIVSLKAPRKLKVCHFKKGTEICNYSYSNTILAVKLNRQVSSTLCCSSGDSTRLAHWAPAPWAHKHSMKLAEHGERHRQEDQKDGSLPSSAPSPLLPCACPFRILKMGSLGSPGCPGACYVEQAGLQITVVHPALPL